MKKRSMLNPSKQKRRIVLFTLWLRLIFTVDFTASSNLCIFVCSLLLVKLHKEVQNYWIKSPLVFCFVLCITHYMQFCFSPHLLLAMLVRTLHNVLLHHQPTYVRCNNMTTRKQWIHWMPKKYNTELWSIKPFVLDLQRWTCGSHMILFIVLPDVL